MAVALKVFAIALALALDVFAVSVGVGVRGVTRAAALRIGAAFACAEVCMNIVGAGLGIAAGRVLGETAGYIGFVALIFLGLYMLYEARRDTDKRNRLDLSHGLGLFLGSLSISLDSLGIGFSILYIGAPLVATLTTIGAVSIATTIVGLSLGHRLGEIVEGRAEILGGVLLTLTGVLFCALKVLHAG